MSPRELFELVDDDHIEHGDMVVTVELRCLDAVVLRCSCGLRIEVADLGDLDAP
jgi:hypothetical protein